MLIFKYTSYDLNGNLETSIIHYKDVLKNFVHCLNNYIADNYTIEYFNNYALIFIKGVKDPIIKLEIIKLETGSFRQYEED